MRFYKGICFVTWIVQIASGEIAKSSLTFVIDDTGSMSDDIQQVKYGVNLVFDTVMKSNTSQIDNFIIVTFNDPGTILRTVTKDRHVFKNSLERIIVDGGGDCPELAMEGIELALSKSLPGSFLYVLTDASAKDAYKVEKVKNMAIAKTSQIVFLLTGRCSEDDRDPQYQAYHTIADATNGQVFHMTKDNVGKILAYVAETIKSRKTVVTSKTLPPGYGHNVTIPVDGDMKAVVIAGSGVKPRIDVTAPDGSKPDTEHIVDIPRVMAVKIKDTKPGNYTAKVGSESETSIVVTATTTIQFKHGFSVVEPSAIEATSIKPLPDQKSHLAIQLITSEDGSVLHTVVLTDLKENLIVEMPLKLIDAKQKLYDTDLFLPPNTVFEITVKGYDEKSKFSFTRKSPTPVEPQKPSLVTFENTAPTVKIEGGRHINAEYNKPLKIICKVNGFPKPDALWLGSDGAMLPSVYSTLEIPYDYINVLEIDKVKNNATYKCKAANTFGESLDIVNVMTLRKNIFNIIEVPKDISIEYKGTKQVTCKIDANPPVKIKWLSKGKEIRSFGHLEISPDGSVLTINDMRKNIEGTYICYAKSDTNEKQFKFDIKISGFERPKVDKTTIEIPLVKGKDAEITCSVLKGKPTPDLEWYHFSPETQRFEMLDDATDEVLRVTNVDEENAGFYRCIATNEAGRDHHMTELIVEYAPTVSTDKKYVRSMEGRKTTLKCLAKGVPKPRVDWFLNDVRIINDRHHHIYRDDSLSFKGSAENVGLFTCVATNHLGSANRTIKVDYIVPVSIDPPSQSTFNVREGENLSLQCIADGFPEPTFTWLFFSSEDNKSPPKKIGPSDASGNLNLRHLRKTQDGYYTCVASNYDSSANFTYNVRVNVPPKIERGPTTFAGVNGDLVLSIPCNATGYPKPVLTWTKGGYHVASGSDWYDVQGDGTLIVKNLDSKAAGRYECSASNTLGYDKRLFYVFVDDYPPETTPTQTITLEKGESTEVECNVPHNILDTIRWYKDRKLIGTDPSLRLINVKIFDSGLYTCRVSNFENSLSESTRVIVGYKPDFIGDPETDINYDEDTPAYLNCEAIGEPPPQVTWFTEDDRIDINRFTYDFMMTIDTIGEYTCVVSNHFGSINRTFKISTKDCILDIEEYIKGNLPLIIDENTLKLPKFKNTDGNLIIPSNTSLILRCSRGFDYFPSYEEITATCDKETNFLVKGAIGPYDFFDLNCIAELQPTIRNTRIKCRPGNTELLKIGYEFSRGFLEVFEVCVNVDNYVPVYAKHTLDRSLSDVELRQSMWLSDSLPLELNEMYKCDNQVNVLTSTLRKWFHPEDKCCFEKRLLVNTRDLPAGFQQKAALNYLNVIPHWSTCNSKNWDELEKRVRKLAKSSLNTLLVWTGTSGQLTLSSALDRPENITLRDTRGQAIPVPQYLWKVIQDPFSRSSVAVVQVNSPDLTASEAYKFMLCRDVCQDIEWLTGVAWRDPAKGYTFCCSLPDFEDAFAYKDQFLRGNESLLTEISGFGRVY